MNRNESIKNFFFAYEARFNDALSGKEDVDSVVNSFASCFVEASPAGINCGKNDESFREAIPKGNEFYRTIGTRFMKITSLAITPLDDLHSMVKVQWDSLYQKKNEETVSIKFQVIYFLQSKGNEHKIFLYITGDEQKAFKEHGLID
jgi:hypothetical protein